MAREQRVKKNVALTVNESHSYMLGVTKFILLTPKNYNIAGF